MLDITGINWLAVLVATLVSFIIGGLWYGVLFSKPWMRFTGITHESASAGSSASMAIHYGGAFASYLIAVAALALLLRATGAVGAGQGLVVGLLVGVGIVAAVSVNTYLFSAKPLGLYLINYGYPAVALAISGVILGAWQ